MATHNYYGLILAGGRGTRFWPRSRRAKAKQVLPFFGERSLIQQTVDRLRPVLPPERLWILTNEYLREEITRQLPEVPSRQILAEPVSRNTAPAIGLAAKILVSLDPRAVMGVFPSDHVIGKPARFLQLVRPAFRAAAQGQMAVIGIQPRWPETGYGYIEFPKNTHGGASDPIPVKRFREKPDLATAKKFMKAGNYYWNAGMFFWRASVVLDNLRRFLPSTAARLDALPDYNHRQFQERLNEVFPQTENISIDYAVLEKAQDVVGFAAGDIGWNDVGSWNAVYELSQRDKTGNASRSPIIVTDASGNYVDAPGKLVALLGVEDLVVVDTPDALLVTHRSRAQQVGEIVKMLEKNKRNDLL
jgi:mannose-1-phosphate guanylyltransferase